MNKMLIPFLMVVPSVCLPATGAQATPEIEVVAEEDVYTFVNPNNGSGPLWCYGSTEIARLGDTVVVSQMETGEDVPPYSNTRWRLLRRTHGDWRLVAEPERYRQREDCPLAVTSNKDLFLYVNDAQYPPEQRGGPCEPHLLKFSFNGERARQTKITPSWPTEPAFTEHSYRGLAADRASNHVLMLNIDNKEGRGAPLRACLMKASGKVVANGAIAYPIRACYPQVALRNRAVHVLAISDIVEPIEAWRKFKFEQTGRSWDFVFRVLYYTYTPDLKKHDFFEPIEIANVDKTAGYIANLDLWLSPRDEAYILYSEREVASKLMRDKFFPDKSDRSLIADLHLAVLQNGQIVSRRVLIPGTDKRQCGYGRFHEAADGTLYALLHVSGQDVPLNLMQIYPPLADPPLIPIPLKMPMGSFCLANVRAGNKPSDIIDMLGHTKGNTLGYAQLRLEKK
ncbi:MAG TPA: hypothetical protein HPP77_02015 [Candidatus Hydrogenedentes bacterium]|nr:hypothetical protein [Candidatus Hydrogenedentota bacterium]HIJ74561.1 hypothetical protein [Candidatus Hydrogenedentota bacterium]